jgi:hypothetical protein
MDRLLVGVSGSVAVLNVPSYLAALRAGLAGEIRVIMTSQAAGYVPPGGHDLRRRVCGSRTHCGEETGTHRARPLGRDVRDLARLGEGDRAGRQRSGHHHPRLAETGGLLT